MWPRRRWDDELLTLYEESGRNLGEAALVLREMVADYPERAHLSGDLVALEHEGDRITHDIIRLLGTGRRRAPFDFADGYALATALDDIVDYAEQTADTLGIYRVEAPMEQAGQMCDVLVGATEHVAAALQGLRSGTDMAPSLVEIHRLENEGDRVSREGMASLFAEGIDPMVVIRWKDIFAALESSVDACEHVAHLLEGIAFRRNRR